MAGRVSTLCRRQAIPSKVSGMNWIADQAEDIARRLKEIEAEKQIALTGTSAPVTGEEPKPVPDDYGYGMTSGWTVQTYVSNGVNVTSGGVLAGA
jgi:hypothetical protein